MNLLWQIFFSIGKIFNVLNGQIIEQIILTSDHTLSKEIFILSTLRSISINGKIILVLKYIGMLKPAERPGWEVIR